MASTTRQSPHRSVDTANRAHIMRINGTLAHFKEDSNSTDVH